MKMVPERDLKDSTRALKALVKQVRKIISNEQFELAMQVNEKISFTICASRVNVRDLGIAVEKAEAILAWGDQ